MKKIWLFFITMILTATCQAQVAPLREQARLEPVIHTALEVVDRAKAEAMQP